MSGPYVEDPPKMGTFSRFQMYERAEMSLAEIYERGWEISYFRL